MNEISISLEKRLIPINGHDLYVEISAATATPPVVLLHQGLGSSVSWKATVPHLVQAGCQVINYDRWGYGASGTRLGLDTPQFQDDVEDLLTLTRDVIGKPVILLGHSDGATISAHFAAGYPEWVAGLISVAAHIYVEPRMEPGIRAVINRFEQDPAFRKSLQRAHGDHYEEVFRNWWLGWLKMENKTWDMRAELHSINCPALIIQGELDEHATPRHAMDMAGAIPGAELCLIPGGRHMFPQENPEEFNKLVYSFLERKCLIKS